MSFQTDYYGWILAYDFGFYPIEDTKYEPLDLAGNDWNFRIANEFRDNTNCLFAVNGDDLEDSQK